MKHMMRATSLPAAAGPPSLIFFSLDVSRARHNRLAFRSRRKLYAAQPELPEVVRVFLQLPTRYVAVT